MARTSEYQSSLRLAQTSVERWPSPGGHSMFGTELAAAGRFAEAEAHLRQAVEAARAAGALPELARCLTDWVSLRGMYGAGGDPATLALDAERGAIIEHLAGAAPRPAAPATEAVRT